MFSELGNYIFAEPIDNGHFGAVYKGQNKLTGREVAIKVQSAGDDPSSLLHETRNLAALSSQYIVPIHTAELVDLSSKKYLLMEMDLIEDGTLSELILSGQMGVSNALRFARHVLHALIDCHTCGIIHRDIKPKNILIRGNDYILGDFGLSRTSVASSIPSKAGYIAHSPPETLKSHPLYDLNAKLCPRYDVYALGITLFRALKGVVDTQQLYQFVRSWSSNYKGETLPEFMGMPKYLPTKLTRILKKSTHPDLHLRYSTAKDMLRDLEKLRASIDWQLPEQRPIWMGTKDGRTHCLKLEKIGKGWQCAYKVNGRKPRDWTNECTTQHKAIQKRDNNVKKTMLV